jgi:hypothetical protein
MARLTEEREALIRLWATQPSGSSAEMVAELLEELDATRVDRHKAEEAWAVELAQVRIENNARHERIKSLRSSLGAKEGQADHEAVIAFLDKMRDLRLDNDNLHKRIQALYEDLKRKCVQEKILQGEIDTAIADRESTLKALSVANAYGERVREERNEEYQRAEKAEEDALYHNERMREERNKEYQRAEKAEEDLAWARMDVAQIKHANAVLVSEKADMGKYISTYKNVIQEVRENLGAGGESVQDAARRVVAERDALRGDLERMRQDHVTSCAHLVTDNERIRATVNAAPGDTTPKAVEMKIAELRQKIAELRQVYDAECNVTLQMRVILGAAPAERSTDAAMRVVRERDAAQESVEAAMRERDEARASMTDQSRVIYEALDNLGLSGHEPLKDATRRVLNELLDARSDIAKARQERDAAIARAEKAEAATLLCDDCANGGAGPAGPCLACRNRDKWTPKAKPTETAEAERDAIQGSLDAAVGARDALDSATQEQIAELRADNDRLCSGLHRLWLLHRTTASGRHAPTENQVIMEDRMPGIISNLLEGKTWEGMDHVVGPAKAPPEVPAEARADFHAKLIAGAARLTNPTPTTPPLPRHVHCVVCGEAAEKTHGETASIGRLAETEGLDDLPNEPKKSINESYTCQRCGSVGVRKGDNSYLTWSTSFGGSR